MLIKKIKKKKRENGNSLVPNTLRKVGYRIPKVTDLFNIVVNVIIVIIIIQ